jgi:hypothetical protein
MKKEEKASHWIPANISISSINLDKKNLRIAWMEDSQISQSTLIKLFWENYNVKELIKSIEAQGFFRHDVPIVFKDSEQKNQYIVVEGNRRLAALKIIQNPEFKFIQPIYRKWLNDISKRIKKDIEIIPVFIAPSWESCLPVMVSKHASEDHSSWKTLMQDYLYWSYLQENPKTSIDTAAAHFNITLKKFNEHVRRYNLFRLIKGVDGLSSDVQSTACNAIVIPITTFERIINVKRISEYLKIPDNWNLKDEKAISFFNNAMRNIITDIINKDETSRSLNTKTEIETLFFKYNKQTTPNPTQSGSASQKAGVKTTGSPVATGGNSSGSEHGSTEVKKPGVTRETKSIMRTRIPFNLQNASALRKIYDELYNLNVDKNPNASVALFRVFLDKATRKLIERHELKKCPVKIKGKWEEKRFTDVNFSDCLTFLTTYPNIDYVPDHVKIALRLFMKPIQAKNCLSGINQLIHNQEITYTPEETKALWPQLESFVKILLTE